MVFRRITKEEFLTKYYNNIGICSDAAYEIIRNGENIGLLMMDECNPHNAEENPYIEWVEIKEEYRGKFLFRDVLNLIFKTYNCEMIQLECTEDLLPMYLHLGATNNGISDLTENYKMTLHKTEFNKWYIVSPEVTDIIWDSESKMELPERVKLPERMCRINYIEQNEFNEEDFMQDIEDYLSDTYEECVEAYCV